MEKEILEKIRIFNDSNFTFNEKYHTYKYKGEKYRSVTNIIKDFCQPFDSDYWSKKKAVDRINESDDLVLTDENIDKVQAEILKEWDYKRDRSCDLGHIVHLYLEQKFSDDLEIEVVNDQEALNRIRKFEERVIPRLKNFKSIAQELRIFSHTLKISGTIDGLFLRFIDGKVKLYILDYKTNGNLKTDKDRNFSKLKPPFTDQWENEHNKYSIQLSLYKLMLAEYGIKVDECALIYIPPSESDPKILKCKDYIPQLEMYFGVNFYSKLEKGEKNLNI